MWFDSHCHLHMCEENDAVERVLERAHGSDVTEMLTVGIDIASNERSIELARRYEGVYASVGIHPNDSTIFSAEVSAGLVTLLADPKAVAVGESGLDFYRDRAPREVQEDAFKAHIKLAKTHDKALVIHTRESIDAALDVMENEGPPPRFVFHCWSGDPAQLERASALGAYISFAGNVSFSSAGNLREVARLVPEDRLVVETDSPFLTPVPHRGQPNEPAHVALVGAAVAAARSEDPARIAASTTRNARALFAL
ncbi:MAG: TatD family hydrolase [Actinomycetota bacterium]